VSPAVGIVHVEVDIPLIAGDVGDPASFPYPVMYETLRGCTVDDIVHGDVEVIARRVIDAARRLEAAGAQVIGADCGTLIRVQSAVASAVRVPVILSPLVAVPLLCAMLGANQSLAVLVASDQRITPGWLQSVGIDLDERIVLRGLQGNPAWRAAIIEESGTLDAEAIEREVVNGASALLAERPDVGAFLLECADLPPYAAALQAATGRPVFDGLTLLDLAHSAARRTSYAALVTQAVALG
jgi:hypothetical protein